jgi:hypothetical protein
MAQSGPELGGYPGMIGAIAALQTRAIAIIYSVFSQQGFFTSYLGLASR